MRCGGGLFFYRGGYGGRPIALRNHAKVCVSKGAPCLGVGCERWKGLVFYVFFLRLVVMMENDAFLARARCCLPLVQGKRSLRSGKRRFCDVGRRTLRFIAGRASSLSFVFSLLLFLSRALYFFVYVCRPSRHRSPFALALFSGAAAAAAGRGSPPPPWRGVVSLLVCYGASGSGSVRTS